jgi:ubiquinone/menaquinone biosynthesis C-methylase UbiE
MSPQNHMQRRSATRTAVVWDALRAVLPDHPASVIDIGGGTGGLAVRVAELGHRVTVVDPSPDALATLSRRAEESGVAERVTGLQGDLAGLLDLVSAGSADLVLCHGVLEIVEDPEAALRSLAEVLRPGGVLSLLVSQRHAAVLTRAMAGHFGQAKALLGETGGIGDTGDTGDTGGAEPPRRFTATEIAPALAQAGFDDVTMQAVRVFVDLVPSSLVDLEPGAAQALVELEHAVADLPEYLPLATQIHAMGIRRRS